MNSAPLPIADSSTAVAALESWFAGVQTDEGTTGPAVGFRANCLGWCGPGNDWRHEGLLDGHALRFQATGDNAHLDAIERAIRQIMAAQLGDGSFRNSYFEWNPFEGGMPHEPAMLAAALRGRKILAAAGRDIPGLADTVTRALDGRHLRLLWNKTLHTVRDWEISDYQFGPSISAAAVLDLILEWTSWQGNWEIYQERADNLASWIRGLQETSGSMAGGIHTSNRKGGGISPFYSSRCLGPLQKYARRTGCRPTAESAEKLTVFLLRQQLPDGGFTRLLWNWRPSSINPLHLGASAAILNALLAQGALGDSDLARHESWLLSHSTPSGAFRNALGYGKIRPGSGMPDWRDWIPSPGWQDKVYLFFCHRAADSKAPFQSAPWSTPAIVCHREGLYQESSDSIEIHRDKETVYLWKKKSSTPLICRLT